MRPVLRLAAAALVLGACSGSPTEIPPPVELVSVHEGLEQQIRVSYGGPNGDDPNWFHLSSRIINRSDAPVEAHVVTCWLDPNEDLRTRAPIDTYAIPGCPGPGPEHSNILQPNQASLSASFSGRVSRSGKWDVEVRQSLDPEFWSRVEIRIP